MELEEIYNFAFSPLITSEFAVEWSEDNHISIVTEKGIHVLELIPSPMSSDSTIKFSRSFIYAPLIFPTKNASNSVEPKIWRMDQEEFYSFLMEEALTPKVGHVKEMAPNIVNLAWSPRDLIHPSKCLVAIVTSTGAIVIAFKVIKDWYPAYDLSQDYNNVMIEKIMTKLKSSDSSSFDIKNCLRSLKATCCVWSKLFIDFAYIAVAYRNGDVIIYKIPRITDCNEIQNSTIVGTLRLNESGRINVLHWITINAEEHLIIVGYFDGRIYGLKIVNHNQQFELKSIEKYYDYQDRIPIRCIRQFPENNSILVAKGYCLFLLRFTENGILKDMRYLQIETFTISGITCISKDCAFITTENGSMFTIKTDSDRFMILKTKNKLSQGNLRYLGLTHSLSSVIFVNVTVPGTVYDHLMVKEPSKMQMFCVKDVKWDPLMSLMLEQERFERSWDCLEALRILATKATNLSTVLPKVPQNLESLSLHDLRIAMWITVIMEICDKKNVIQGISNIAGEISEAQPLIFLHTACEYLTTLIESKSSLTEEHKHSMTLLKAYLEKFLAEKEGKEASTLSNRVEDILAKLSQFNLNSTETCNLCEEVIDDQFWKITKCSQGHMLPRCAITLLQITSISYKICPICGLIFHQCVEQVFKETRCLFCDVPALQERRMLDEKYNILTDKSLSKIQNVLLEMTSDPET